MGAASKSFAESAFRTGCYLGAKPYRSFIRKDIYRYFEEYGLKVEEYIHCDYSRVLVLKKEEQNETPSDMRYLEQTKMLELNDAPFLEYHSGGN